MQLEEQASAAGTPETGESQFDRVLRMLPRGDTLPDADWIVRHRAVLWVLFLHVPALFVFGYFGGRDTLFTKAVYDSYSITQTLVETGVITLFGLIAAWPRLSRRIRGSSASLGLITASAVLVQFSGGYIEAHFHFFVILALLALYEDWIPFLLGIGYVLVHHGTVGTIDPGSVYNHSAAIAYPWRWATVHALFIAALCGSLITTWRMNEEARADRRRVLQAASDGILGLGPDGRVTFANPAASRMLGGPDDPSELVGEPLGELLDWAGEPPEQAPIEALSRGVTLGPVEGSLSTGDEEEIPIEWTSRPIWDRGHPVGAVLTLKDVTGQKSIQAELQAHARRLKQSNEEWKNFARVVSHDLQEPVRTVASYCQLVRDRYHDRLDDDAREFLEYATQGSKRMRELVRGLESFARVETRGQNFERMDLDKVVREALESLEILRAETDAEIEISPLPEVVGDRPQMAQLFQNLLSNALKYSGDEPPRVRIWAEDREDVHVIHVEDEGVGMNPAYTDKIFDMFEQLEPEGDGRGQGIGLAICKAIVDRHGGRIGVTTAPGEGSRFNVTLPKEPEPLSEAQPGILASTRLSRGMA